MVGIHDSEKPSQLKAAVPKQIFVAFKLTDLQLFFSYVDIGWFIFF